MLRSRHHKAHLIQKLTASSYMPLLGVVIVLKLESCSAKMTLSILSMMWKNQQRAGSNEKKLGGNGVPVLVINGEVVKGYNPTKILELVNKKI